MLPILYDVLKRIAVLTMALESSDSRASYYYVSKTIYKYQALKRGVVKYLLPAKTA